MNTKDTFSLLIFFFYSVLLLFLLPDSIILRSDDFGYIESLSQTIRNSVFIQSDWLEPYSIFNILLSAKTYQLTSNMYLSTYGIIFLFCILNFFLTKDLLTHYTSLDQKTASIFTFFILGNFVYLNKALEYTGTIPSLFFFLLALYSYKQKNCLLFFLAVCLGFSIRQSMIALLALPLYEIARAIYLKQKYPKLPQIIIGVIISFGFIFYLISSIPETFAQTHFTKNIIADLRLSKVLHGLLVGCLLSLSSLVLFSIFKNKLKKVQSKKIIIAIFIIMLVLIYKIYFWNNAQWLRFELVEIEKYVDLFLTILFAFSIITFFIFSSNTQISTKQPLLFLLLAYIFMTALKKDLWLYYYFEIIFLSMITFNFKADDSVSFSKLKTTVAISLFILNLLSLAIFKIQLEKTQIQIYHYEKLTRQNIIDITHTNDAPFGYLGWKLFDYAKENETKYIKQGLANFIYLTAGGLIHFEWEYPWDQNLDTHNKQVILSGKKHLLGFMPVNYKIIVDNQYLIDPNAIPFKFDRSKYKSKIYPLNEKEWQSLVMQ